jgi:periplasmic divalent cation tolerance protein
VKACVVLTTFPPSFDAAALAKSLVERRLAACVNIVPEVRSIYRWNEGVDDEREQLLVIKTTDERVEALREALVAGHPYDVPEFVVLPADAHGAYGGWLIESVAPRS